ncbi:MAG: cytochrome c oxidase subunit II [Anaerolineales bacterium]
MERYLNLPLSGSAHGGELDYLTALVHWLMLILFVGWAVYFVLALFLFRGGRHKTARYAGAKGHFSTYGEVGVAIVEIALLVGFAVPMWARRVAALTPEERAQAVEVRVVAEQFAWNVHYPGRDGRFGRTDRKLISPATNPLGLDRDDPAAADDIATINQLHLPVGRPALIRLSTKDVIHSFFLPTMRVKQDAIPGMEIPIHFTPTVVTPAEAKFPACAATMDCWEIACAQLCGLTHYRMKGFFTVHDAAGYDAWLAENAPKPAALPAAAPTTGP